MSPIDQILSQLRDGAFVRGRHLKAAIRALSRGLPIPGKGLASKEYPDGTVFSSTAADPVLRHPFFCEVTDTVGSNWIVTVQPGQVRAAQNSATNVPTIAGNPLTDDPPPTLAIPQHPTITYAIHLQINYTPTFLEGWTTGVFDLDSVFCTYANEASFPTDSSGLAFVAIALLAPGGIITNLVQTNLSVIVDDDGTATENAALNIFYGGI